MDTKGLLRQLSASCILLAAVVQLPTFARAGEPLGTAIGIQAGVLFEGAPADGDFDIELRLFDGALAGLQVGPLVGFEGVQITGGLLNLEADFGDVFSGERRYLQIGIRPGDADADPFTTLEPRIELTPVAHAHHAVDAGTVGGLAAGDLLDKATYDADGNEVVDLAERASDADQLGGLTPDAYALLSGGNIFSGSQFFAPGGPAPGRRVGEGPPVIQLFPETSAGPYIVRVSPNITESDADLFRILPTGDVFAKRFSTGAIDLQEDTDAVFQGVRMFDTGGNLNIAITPDGTGALGPENGVLLTNEIDPVKRLTDGTLVNDPEGTTTFSGKVDIPKGLTTTQVTTTPDPTTGGSVSIGGGKIQLLGDADTHVLTTDDRFGELLIASLAKTDGPGSSIKVQAGDSATSPGGKVEIAGGNSGATDQPGGDVLIQAGTSGDGLPGGSIHLLGTTTPDDGLPTGDVLVAPDGITVVRPAEFLGGIRIIDISDPTNPVVVASINSAGDFSADNASLRELNVSGTGAFRDLAANSLNVDDSTIANNQIIGGSQSVADTITIGSGPEAVELERLADGSFSVRVMNGTDPDGALRYNPDPGQWELSNAGGPFVKVATGEGGGTGGFQNPATEDLDMNFFDIKRVNSIISSVSMISQGDTVSETLTINFEAIFNGDINQTGNNASLGNGALTTDVDSVNINRPAEFRNSIKLVTDPTDPTIIYSVGESGNIIKVPQIIEVPPEPISPNALTIQDSAGTQKAAITNEGTGIFNDVSAGTLTIINSTITGNQAIGGNQAVGGTATHNGPIIQNNDLFSFGNGALNTDFDSVDFFRPAEFFEGLRIIDISDPTNPTEVGSFDTLGNLNANNITGQDLTVNFVEAQDQTIVDTLTLNGPVIQTNDVASLGNGALTTAVDSVDFFRPAEFFDGWKVFDLSDPTNPTEVGSFDTLGMRVDKATVRELATSAIAAQDLLIGGSVRIGSSIPPTGPDDPQLIIQVESELQALLQEWRGFDGTTVASLSADGVYTGDGSGLFNISVDTAANADNADLLDGNDSTDFFFLFGNNTATGNNIFNQPNTSSPAISVREIGSSSVPAFEARTGGGQTFAAFSGSFASDPVARLRSLFSHKKALELIGTATRTERVFDVLDSAGTSMFNIDQIYDVNVTNNLNVDGMVTISDGAVISSSDPGATALVVNQPAGSEETALVVRRQIGSGNIQEWNFDGTPVAAVNSMGGFHASQLSIQNLGTDEANFTLTDSAGQQHATFSGSNSPALPLVKYNNFGNASGISVQNTGSNPSAPFLEFRDSSGVVIHQVGTSVADYNIPTKVTTSDTTMPGFCVQQTSPIAQPLISAVNSSGTELWAVTTGEVRSPLLYQITAMHSGSTNPINLSGSLSIFGDLNVSGGKNFVQPHPTDDSKEIVYVALEGPEAGTYCRGEAQLEGGEAVIALDESFALVTSPEGMTVQVTPMGPCEGLYVAEYDRERIVVRELRGGTSNVRFHWQVNGVRAGFEDHQVIRDARERPELASAQSGG